MKHCLEISHAVMLYVFLGRVTGGIGLHRDLEMIPAKTNVFLFYAKV